MVIDTFGDSASTTVIGYDADDVVDVIVDKTESFAQAPLSELHLTPLDVFLDCPSGIGVDKNSDSCEKSVFIFFDVDEEPILLNAINLSLLIEATSLRLSLQV